MNKTARGFTFSILALVIDLVDIIMLLVMDWRVSESQAFPQGMLLLIVAVVALILAINSLRILRKDESSNGINASGKILSVCAVIVSGIVGFIGIAFSGIL